MNYLLDNSGPMYFEQNNYDTKNDELGPDGTLIMYFIMSFFILLIKLLVSFVVKSFYIIIAHREKKLMDAECDRKNIEYMALKKSMEPVKTNIREKYIEINGKWVKTDA